MNLKLEFLGFIVIEDYMITAKKRWLVIAPSGLSDTKIILAKASTKAQIRAIGQQTGDRVGFFLHSDSFATDYYTMRAARVVFEETPRQEAYGGSRSGATRLWQSLGPVATPPTLQSGRLAYPHPHPCPRQVWRSVRN